MVLLGFMTCLKHFAKCSELYFLGFFYGFTMVSLGSIMASFGFYDCFNGPHLVSEVRHLATARRRHCHAEVLGGGLMPGVVPEQKASGVDEFGMVFPVPFHVSSGVCSEVSEGF